MVERSQLLMGGAISLIILLVVLYYLLRPTRNSAVVLWDLIDAHKQGASGQVIKEGVGVPLKRGSIDGSEFSVSLWLYIKDWNHNFGKYKHVFHLGSNREIGTGSFALKLHPTLNKLFVSTNVYPEDIRDMNRVKKDVLEVNVPLQKWVNVSVSVLDRVMDVYLNGELVVSKLLSGVIRLPIKTNAYFVKYGGFNGQIGRARVSNLSSTPSSVKTSYLSDLSSVVNKWNLKLPFKLDVEGEGDEEDDVDPNLEEFYANRFD